MNDNRQQMRKSLARDILVLAAVVGIAVALLLLFPGKQAAVTSTSWDYLMEMIVILPGVMVIMGLFAVWVPNKAVVRYLGHTSGVKGMALSLFMGMLPTGPLYVAFPMAAGLLKKGARVANVIVFLSAWACIKLPQELVELEFMGARFMALRLTLTVVFVVIMGMLIERVAGKREDHVYSEDILEGGTHE
ncbi:MAG: permease [Thermoplasmatota archaeon]